MKRTQNIIFAILLLAGLLAPQRRSFAAEASSTFSTGFDGWQTSFSEWSWQAEGGNPGGFIQLTDSLSPNFTALYAPASFFGDWSSLDGIGSFRYDFRVFSGPPGSTLGGLQVNGGNGGVMFWHPSTTSGSAGWETLVAPLTEENWEIRSGTWDGILSDVTGVQIYPHYFDAHGEVTGVDNIMLVPEPGVFTPLGTGIVLCLLCVRFRKCGLTMRCSEPGYRAPVNPAWPMGMPPELTRPGLDYKRKLPTSPKTGSFARRLLSTSTIETLTARRTPRRIVVLSVCL